MPPKGKAKELPPLEHAKAVEMVPLDVVQFNPWQPRSGLDDDVIKLRVDSIRSEGLMQYPTGRWVGDQLQIADGAYRFAAFCLLAADDDRYKEIPVIVREISDLEMAVTGLEANRQRLNLTAMEEARSYQKILTDFPEMTAAELGRRVGLDRSTITYAVRTLELPPQVVTKSEELGLALGVVRLLLPFQSKAHAHVKTMMYFLDKMEERGATTRQALLDFVKMDFQENWVNGGVPGTWLNLKDSYDIRFDIKVFTKDFEDYVHNVPGRGAYTCNRTAFEERNEAAAVDRRRAAKEKATTWSVTEVAQEAIREVAAEAAAAQVEPEPDPAPVAHVTDGDTIDAAAIRARIVAGDFLVECTTCGENVRGIAEDVEDGLLGLMTTHAVDEHDFKLEELQESVIVRDADGGGWDVTSSAGVIWLFAHDEEELLDEEVEEEAPPTVSLLEVLPEAADGPTVGPEVLPDGFDMPPRRQMLKEVRLLLEEGVEPGVVIRDHADLVNMALGTRAQIYAAGALNHEAKTDLYDSTLRRLKDPQECRKRCTWGAALQRGYHYRDEEEGAPSWICTNLLCFKAKEKAWKQEQGQKGADGVVSERAALEEAAVASVERGTFDAGRGECIVLLSVLLDDTNSYQGGRRVRWWDLLLPRLGLEGNVDDPDVRNNGWDALGGKSVEELRQLVLEMALERLRSHEKPLEWEARLAPHLKALQTEGVG